MSEPLRTKRAKPAKWYAEKYRISVRTVQRIAAVQRTEWEANSITQTKPWEAIGMSRRSWYRHGKPTENPRDIAGSKKNTSSSTASQPS